VYFRVFDPKKALKEFLNHFLYIKPCLHIYFFTVSLVLEVHVQYVHDVIRLSSLIIRMAYMRFNMYFTAYHVTCFTCVTCVTCVTRYCSMLPGQLPHRQRSWNIPSEEHSTLSPYVLLISIMTNQLETDLLFSTHFLTLCQPITHVSWIVLYYQRLSQL
jgi:hypothetical protein